MPGGFQTFNSSAVNAVLHQSVQLRRSCGCTHTDSPSLPHNTRAAQRGSLHPPAAPGATFHFPAHPTQDLPIPLHSLKLCSPGSQLQQNSSPLSLEPRVWWLDNKTFVVFLKQVVHTQPEPFSQHLSLQTKLQRQAFSFLVSFFYYYFLLFLFFFLEEKFGDGS